MAEKSKVLVDYSVQKKLLGNTDKLEEISCVYLGGDVEDGIYNIISCMACTSTNRITKESNYFPQGIKICGIFYLTPTFQELDLAKAKELVGNLWNKESSYLSNESFVIWQRCMTSKDDNGWLYDTSSDCITKCSLMFSDISATFLQDKVTFRIQASFHVQVEYNFEALKDRLRIMVKDLRCPSTTFLIKDCNMLLYYDENINASKQNQVERTCQDLLRVMKVDQEEIEVTEYRKSKSSGESSKKCNTRLTKDAIDVKLLTKITSSKDSGFVPIIFYRKEQNRNVTVSLPLDTVVIAENRTPLTDLPKIFVSAIEKQLNQIENTMQMFSKETRWCVPRPYHFKPPGSSHLLSVVYPEITNEGAQADDDYLEHYRIELHKTFVLPLNRPLLRVCNSYVFDKDRKSEPYLINPHTGISTSKVSDISTIGLVDGYYSYHHYMQDNFNDDKWGCAYRSLQTICSWFKHQGYTSKPVPSHKEIQQALVDVGDKNSNFVGSKQWIGSFEVSMCLEKLLGVYSKIMFVSSGAEIASKGRELVCHFETQGTPIMIGGGVLAHTIIGVDFDQQSGDIKFLILDPHYKGSEDLRTILNKGWCGWKGPSFWNQQAHYNMCMPQRPNII